MEYRRLGRTDLYVSSIGLGCVTFGREIDERVSFAVMDRAVERGINLLDTAESYSNGGSEEVIGRWLRARRARDRMLLMTKVWGTLTRERVLTSAAASVRRLQTDRIDLFLLHGWDETVPLEETLAALDTLVRQGLVRTIGCSNFAAWQLCKALWRQDVHGWARMESVQPNYNLVVRDIEAELLPLCADQQVGVITYSPLGAGFLAGTYRQDRPVPKGTRFDIVPGFQPIYFHETGFRILAGLQAKAAELGTPMTHLALAWVMSQPGLTSVLIGAESPAHIDQAFAAEAIDMTAKLRAELSALEVSPNENHRNRYSVP